MMDVKAALDYMRTGSGLGIRSGRIDCYMVNDQLIECDAPGGKGTVDLSPSEFIKQFAHNSFRKLTTEDYAR